MDLKVVLDWRERLAKKCYWMLLTIGLGLLRENGSGCKV